MNTTPETPKSAELAILKGYVDGEVDFDSLFDEDSKEIAKKREKNDKKEGKRIQLLAQINGVKLKKQKLKGMYVSSLTDPTTDSVSIWVGAGIGSCPTKRIGELLFEIEKLKKELAKSNFDSDKYIYQLFENFHESTLEDIHKVVECRDKILELKVSSGLREEIVDFMLKPLDTLLHA